MRIAICDDSVLDREIIRDFLQMYTAERAISVTIEEYANGMQLVYDVEDGRFFDVIFLDILMDGLHGMDIARNLRKMDYNGKIVFLTCTADFAVDSYEVEAAGYLLKPHYYEKFCALFDRIAERMPRDGYRLLSRGRVVVVPYDEIVYVESCNNTCTLHRAGGAVYTIYKKLSEIEQALTDRRFLRCHQSFLVNMRYIAKADKQFELTTGDVVLIRQRSLREIRQTYLDYTTMEMKP